jgi:hypothetical protein
LAFAPPVNACGFADALSVDNPDRARYGDPPVKQRRNSKVDHLLDPLQASLTPELAQRIVSRRADPAVQARPEWLATRHSRRVEWARHVTARDGMILGVTPGGRTTVQLLWMNDPLRVALRRETAS